MTYKVKYTQQTKSRCGSYNYNYCDKVEAENENEAKQKIKELLAAGSSFKRYKVIFREITVIE